MNDILFITLLIFLSWMRLVMKVSYNRLWKRLIDENMMKRDLRLKAGLTTNVIAKMGKNEHVSTEEICKICETLNCNVDDVIEFLPDDK